jgi:hypothetical protein
MSANLSTSASSPRRLLVRVLLPILAACALIAGVNVGLGALGLKLRDSCWGKCYPEYDVVYSRAVEARNKGKRVVAFIGDSRIEWGIDPEAVQAALERQNVRDVEVFNLAIPGRNVRTMLTRLNEAGFHPDMLVVGYSHLSFYWSKNYVTEQPHHLSWWTSDLTRIRSFVQRKIVVMPYALSELQNFLRTGVSPAGGSWLDEVTLSPRGQARVHYKMPQDEAVAFQKNAYKAMYSVAMTDDMIAETNASFLKDMSVQRARGARVLLLKMPLSSWALDLERANERASLADLAGYLKVPFADGNDVPGAVEMQSFDGLHLAPPAATAFSRWVAENVVLPNLK